jgi:hypothetical protein
LPGVFSFGSLAAGDSGREFTRRKRRESVGITGVWESPPVPRRPFLPRELVPFSGRYAIVDLHGNALGREIICARGETFPPFADRRVEFGYSIRDMLSIAPRGPHEDPGAATGLQLSI